jgi:hypothetical protein
MSTTVESIYTGERFDLTAAVIDDSDTCACPDCENDVEGHNPERDLSILLVADVGGLEADFGTVEFCSMACVRKFDELGLLEVSLDGANEALISLPGPTTVARVTHDAYREPVFISLGEDTEAALQQAREYIEEAAGPGYDFDGFSIDIERL